MKEYNPIEVRKSMVHLLNILTQYKSFTYDDTDIDMIIVHTEMNSLISELSLVIKTVISLIDDDTPRNIVGNTVNNVLELNSDLNVIADKLFNLK